MVKYILERPTNKDIYIIVKNGPYGTDSWGPKNGFSSPFWTL